MVKETRMKQTEIGLIPEDWEVHILNDFTMRIGDGIHSTPIYSKNGQYFFINGNNLVDGKIVCDNETKTVSREQFKIHQRDLNSRTILLSINGTIGNISFYNNEPVILGKSACYINLKDNISKEYVYNVLQSSLVQKYFFDNLTGSTIKNLGLGIIKNTPLPLPPLAEQEAIATALSDCDSWIDSIEEVLAKKRLIKQGAMQELLTPKEDWEVKKLGEVGKIFGGLSGKTKEDFGSGNAFYIPFMNVMKNVVIDKGFIEKFKIKNGESQNRFYKNDLLFNGSSETPEELGISSVLLDDIDDLYLNSFCFGFRIFDKNVNPLFLSYIMRSPYGRKVIFYLAQGATRYNLSKANFFNLEISFPKSLSKQTRIATILSDMDLEIEALEGKLHKARQIKQGMMQELLTGRVRLV